MFYKMLKLKNCMELNQLIYIGEKEIFQFPLETYQASTIDKITWKRVCVMYSSENRPPHNFGTNVIWPLGVIPTNTLKVLQCL